MNLLTEAKFVDSVFEGKKGDYKVQLIDQGKSYKAVILRYSSGIAWNEVRSSTKDKLSDAEELYGFYLRQFI